MPEPERHRLSCPRVDGRGDCECHLPLVPAVVFDPRELERREQGLRNRANPQRRTRRYRKGIR